MSTFEKKRGNQIASWEAPGRLSRIAARSLTAFVRTAIAVAIALRAVSGASAWAVTSISEQSSEGAQFAIDGGTLRVQFWSPGIVRITYARGPELPVLKSLSVTSSPANVFLKRRESRKAFTLASPNLKAHIDKQTGAVSFLNSAGRPILLEAAHGRKFDPATVAGASITSVAQTFQLPSDEGIYGLGQHQRGAWNYPASGAGGANP